MWSIQPFIYVIGGSIRYADVRQLKQPMVGLKAEKNTYLQQVCSHLATDLLSTSRYQDGFTWLVTACWRQVCFKLSRDVLQVDCQNFVIHRFPASCNKSANDKLQQVWFEDLLTSWNKTVILTTSNKSVAVLVMNFHEKISRIILLVNSETNVL